MTTLLHERGTLGFALTAALDAVVGRLLDVARERVNGDAGTCASALAREWIELQALRYTNYRALGTLRAHRHPGPGGLGDQAALVGAEPAADEARRASCSAPDGILDDGWWHHQQLRSRGNTIEAGTSEVLRNIVAERVLGLPRAR